MSDPSPVAGDFVSLLARHQVSPLCAVASPGAPVQTQGTTVFAFHFEGGVLMCGDRRATAGNVIVTDRVDEVLELDATSLLAIAGVPATAFEMARVLETSFERSEEHTSELQSPMYLVCRLLLEKKKKRTNQGRGLRRRGVTSNA